MRRDLNLNTVTLWAMWHPTVIYMQDWNGCSSLEQDNGSNGNRISITLTDKRDGNTYTVAKLKDGKCWMTQNLRIHNYSAAPIDTDIIDGTFNIPTSKSLTNASFTSVNTNEVYIRDSNYGGYYSWFTATAGNTNYNSSGYEAPNSICPKNWHLPSLDEAQKLTPIYYTNAEKPPSNFILSNSYVGTNFRNNNVHGWWLSHSRAFTLMICGPYGCGHDGVTNFYTQEDWHKPSDGLPIRCVSTE